MPRRLVQQQMAFDNLKWPFHALRAISAIAEFFASLQGKVLLQVQCLTPIIDFL